jgi:chemosensory pili system protein ChpA (sensor histidine kinase/response regulator)
VTQASQEFVEVFLTEASDHLQFLREYAGVLLDPYPSPEVMDRLYVAAHTLEGASAMYGYPLFSEVAGKLSHIFQYAMNATIGPDAAGPLVEFISEGVSLLESDLLFISANSAEAADDIAAFKERYPFAFQATVAETAAEHAAPSDSQQPSSEPRTAAPAIEELPPDGDVPEEILEFFVPEAEEHLQVVTDCLLALETSPNAEDIHRLFRAMHTVKGSAAQVGLQRIARVAHRAEDLVGRLRDGQLRPSAQIVDICLEAVDALKKFLYRQWPNEDTMKAAVGPLLVRIARLAPEEGDVATAADTASRTEEFVTAGAEVPAVEPIVSQSLPATPQPAPARVAPAEAVQTAEAAASGEAADGESTLAGKKELAAMPQSKSVRIALERLDRMMNAVGELVINRTRMIGRVAELERLADVLNFSKGRMSEKVSEFQEKHEFSRLAGPSVPAPAMPSYPAFGSSLSDFSSSADPDFSELEMDRYDDFNILSRSLTEISADITEVLTQLGGFVRRVDSDIDEFSKLAHRLQDEITQARMVPIGNLYTRISRTVRDAAKASGKQVELTLAGAETELDNNIIQQISDPLVHLVRNAVAHGLEKTEDRYHAGKADQGNVAVRAYHRGNHIYIEVEDDGRGIDYARVRSTAIEAGLVTLEDADRLAERDLLEFLFHPGFSTAPKKTELAGRGVGLDVVRANLAALNGEVDVETELGKGTRFTLKVPLTLIISQALFVRCGTSTFALPLSFVEEIRRLNQAEIEEVGGKLLTRVRGVVTEVLRLDAQLGLDLVEPVNGWYRLVIVNVGGRHVGLVVEEVLRKDEIVIKGLGDYLRNVKMFPGATIAPDGALILLIDVNRLVAGESIERRPLMTAGASRVFAPGATAVAAGSIPVAAVETVPTEKIVVLADDSISVRKFVGRMLEKAGYRVRLASDGLEALEICTQNLCDLLVTDLEMPRTNGYELMAHLRQDASTRSLPVMVVTSRAGAKHRERALKEGASAFMTKPVQEDMFLAAIADLIGPAVLAAEPVMETVS